MHVGKPWQYISVTDPAINQPAMGPSAMGQYLEKGDKTLLKYLAGQKPAQYTCRRINSDQMQQYVQRGQDRQENWNRAFRLGCLRIDNAIDADEKRHPFMEPAFEQPAQDGTIIKSWTDAQMRMIPSCVINDVGRVVYQHSFLAQSTGVCYPVPLLFRTDVETLLFRDVGAQEEASPPSTS